MLTDRRYEVGERIASGGMADVFVARDTTLDRLVAVKRLKAELNTAEAKERFAREAFALAGFSHPNAVAVYDFGDDADGPYIVMELVDGPTLAQHLRDRGPLSVDEATAIAVQVLAALGAAHAKGIVHRDVKPANVLLADQQHVKLADFGIAKAVSRSDPDVTLHGQVIGTPKYLAPERAMGHEATPQSDLYAVAVICYEMVVGSVPFLGDSSIATLEAQRNAPVPSVRAARLDVPAPWAEAVERALAKDPRARFANADAMRGALVAGSVGTDATVASTAVARAEATATMPTAALGAASALRAPQRPTPTQPSRPRSRRRWIAVPLVLAALALGGLALAGVVGGGDDGSPSPLPVPATEATIPVTTPPVTVPPTVAPTVPQIGAGAVDSGKGNEEEKGKDESKVKDEGKGEGEGNGEGKGEGGGNGEGGDNGGEGEE